MRRIRAIPAEIVPRDLEFDFKRMVAQFIEEQVREAMSHRTDSTFQPFFQTKEIAREIKRRQTVTEQKKFVYAYEDGAASPAERVKGHTGRCGCAVNAIPSRPSGS